MLVLAAGGGGGGGGGAALPALPAVAPHTKSKPLHGRTEKSSEDGAVLKTLRSSVGDCSAPELPAGKHLLALASM